MGLLSSFIIGRMRWFNYIKNHVPVSLKIELRERMLFQWLVFVEHIDSSKLIRNKITGDLSVVFLSLFNFACSGRALLNLRRKRRLRLVTTLVLRIGRNSLNNNHLVNLPKVGDTILILLSLNTLTLIRKIVAERTFIPIGRHLQLIISIGLSATHQEALTFFKVHL